MTAVIVSAYYRIPSKQPHEFYVPHIKRFLSGVKSFILFFTEPELVEEFSILRGDLPIQFVTEFDIFKKRNRTFWEKQCEIDVEKYHTPELGAIWFNKKEFVLRATEIIGRDCPYIWCDAGCVRYEQDISEFGTRNAIPPGKLLLQTFCEIPNDKFFRFPFIGIAGAIMAGYPEAWKRMSILYDVMIDTYTEHGVCCNMDQYILASIQHDPIFESRLVQDWFDFLKML
jgi:hypothetical protein